MKTKKKLTSRAGFTLVELVVAIAILAILAGIGGAAYSGYIKRAQEAKDVALLADVLTAAQASAAADGEGEAVYSISIAATTGSGSGATGGAITVNIGTSVGDTLDLSNTFTTVYGGTTCVLSSDTYKDGAHWTAADSKWAAGPLS